MAARFKGDVSVRQINSGAKWDNLNGWTRTVKYRGKLADIEAASINNTYVQGASKIDVDQNGDQAQDAILTVTFAARTQQDAINSIPAVNEFSNTWVLSPAEDEVAVERHAAFRGLGRITSEEGLLQRVLVAVQEYRNKVANGISNNTSDKDLVFSIGDYITNNKGTVAQQALANELAQILIEGQETEVVDRYALRNSRVVPGNSNLVASHVKSRFMWSNNRIVSLINSSSPGITQRGLIGDISRTLEGTYWYKLAPTIEEMTNGRYQINTEFINYSRDEFNTTLRPIYA